MSRNKTRVVTLIIKEIVGKSFKCLVPGQQPSFFLPRSQIKPVGPERPRFNQPINVEMPEWLALNHKQICGDAAFEANKRERR